MRSAWQTAAVLALLAAGCDRPAATTGNSNAVATDATTGVRTTEPRTTAADVLRDLRHAAETAAEYSSQKAQSLRDSLRAKLATVDDEIDELQRRGAAVREEARIRFNERMERVREQRKVVEAKLESLKDATPSAWNEIKEGFANAASELQRAYEDAKRTVDEDATAPQTQPTPIVP